MGSLLVRLKEESFIMCSIDETRDTWRDVAGNKSSIMIHTCTKYIHRLHDLN